MEYLFCWQPIDVVKFSTLTSFQLIRTDSYYTDNCVFRLETQLLILKHYFASINSMIGE